MRLQNCYKLYLRNFVKSVLFCKIFNKHYLQSFLKSATFCMPPNPVKASESTYVKVLIVIQKRLQLVADLKVNVCHTVRSIPVQGSWHLLLKEQTRGFPFSYMLVKFSSTDNNNPLTQCYVAQKREIFQKFCDYRCVYGKTRQFLQKVMTKH